MFFHSFQRVTSAAFFVSILTVDANDSHGPINVARLSNTKVIITCSAPEDDFSYIDWAHQNRYTSSPHTLSNNTGGNVSTNYLMLKLKNEESLVINSVQLRDAGVYYCIITNVAEGVSEEVGGHLIVLASDPTCDVENVTVIENDYIRLQCSVSYGGLWRPVMEWTQLGYLGQEKINNDNILVNVTESQQYTNLAVSLQILATPYHNSISFVCSTYFNYSDVLVKQKVNNKTPDYNHVWKSPKINVMYGPKNVSIYPESDTFYPGDKLSCSAIGNPTPEYEWIDNETVQGQMGSHLDIVEFMIREQPYVFKCRARNALSESFANLTFDVKTWFYIPIGMPISVGTLSFLLIVTIISVCLYYWRGPCIQGIRVDPVTQTLTHSEVQMASVIPHVRVEPLNECASSAVYEDIRDINISIIYQQAGESNTDYMELRERDLFQTVYARLHAL